MALQTEETESTPMPIWLSVPIILLCLASGGWIIHWYVMTDPVSRDTVLLGQPVSANQPFMNRVRPPSPQRSMLDKGNGSWALRTDQARADVSVATGKPQFRIITYLNYNFVPDDAKNTIYAARSLVADSERTKALKLSTQQVNKLRQLSNTINMIVAPSDRDSLGAAVLAYTNSKPADRPALEIKLLQELDDVAQKSMQPTRQQAVDRAKQINAMISPDQWKQNAAMGGAK